MRFLFLLRQRAVSSAIYCIAVKLDPLWHPRSQICYHDRLHSQNVILERVRDEARGRTLLLEESMMLSTAATHLSFVAYHLLIKIPPPVW